MSERGVFITPLAQPGGGWELPFTVEGDLLVFRHPSGKHWWLQRIAVIERPQFLKLYYDPQGKLRPRPWR